MAHGIRATVEFTTPGLCPIVDFSATVGTTIDAVSRGVCPPDCSTCVSEFSVEGEADTVIEFDAISGTDATPELVFSHGSTHRYRLTHDDGINCPCECLGQFGCSVSRYVASEGSLTIVFYAADYDQLQTVVVSLRDRFPGVDIKRLIQSPGESDHQDSVFVDRGRLTDRQLEVLQTAYEMGYFDRPRESNATDVARALAIDPSTFGEHLAAAQSKLLQDLLEDGS